jgi:hypothetical protein
MAHSCDGADTLSGRVVSKLHAEQGSLIPLIIAHALKVCGHLLHLLPFTLYGQAKPAFLVLAYELRGVSAVANLLAVDGKESVARL